MNACILTKRHTVEIKIEFPAQRSARQNKASLYSAAAIAELKAEPADRWVVLVQQSGDGAVVFELATGSEAEIQRAQTVARHVAEIVEMW